MKKVAINSCYGGFSLSPLAVKRIAELNGEECYFFNFDLHTKQYREISIEEAEKSFCFSAYKTKNWDYKEPKNWASQSLEERIEYNKFMASISLDSRPNQRDNPFLIQAIEELGDKANGPHAKIKIVEIPDDVEYEIDEYDGIEHIAEVHRRWY